MYLKPSARLAIYAQGEFGKGHCKTAEAVIRYARNPIVSVIDKSEAGNSVHSAVGIDCPAPIVASFEDALQHKPDALLLGAAWTSGHMPQAWRQDENIFAAAQQHKKLLRDIRHPTTSPVAAALARLVKAFTVLTEGTDCNVGKMTTSLELGRQAKKRGRLALQ